MPGRSPPGHRSLIAGVIKRNRSGSDSDTEAAYLRASSEVRMSGRPLRCAHYRWERMIVDPQGAMILKSLVASRGRHHMILVPGRQWAEARLAGPSTATVTEPVALVNVKVPWAWPFWIMPTA